ncbi:MAG: hypothetical protein H6577_14900 [Lewinellaceae bacterium]|nr:hypothetical protein [Saprospiraceae bacterium]MCB9339416.1 hypothetical protein [Lewinellaceae bacterium]
MQITDRKTLKDIQQEFSGKFPYLKLEFYKGKHESGAPSPAGKQLDPEKTIGQVRTVHSEGELSIDGHLKVSSLEDRFWEQYGLNVQVFRLSGNLWLQTSTTDQWTLAEQNRKGEHSAEAYKEMHGE